MNKKKKIIIIINSLWNLFNFRKNLLKNLIKKNYDISIIAPFDYTNENILKLGCRIIKHDFYKRKTNIILEIYSLLKLGIILYKEKPDLCLSFTIKPNIYGSLMCRVLKIPIINNITGIGYFAEKGIFLRYIILSLYKISFKGLNFIFFQNNEDLNYFRVNIIKNKKNFDVLPGSGIDLVKFNRNGESFYGKKVKTTFLLASRLLWAKGLKEFYSAAILIKKKYPEVQFNILGSLEGESSDAVDLKILSKWESENVIRYLGFTDNIKKYLIKTHCLILPTFYNEGTPKVILEASALKVPVITTNIKGCKNAVKNNVTGFLCKPKDYYDLYLKIEKFIKLTYEEKIEMGRNARVKMEKYYNENIVIKKYDRRIKSLLSR